MNKELIQKLAFDKYLHYKYGFVLYLFFSLFSKKSYSIVSFIAKVKEFLDGLGFGTKEDSDYLATMQGADAAIEFLKEHFNRG